MDWSHGRKRWILVSFPPLVSPLEFSIVLGVNVDGRVVFLFFRIFVHTIKIPINNTSFLPPLQTGYL